MLIANISGRHSTGRVPARFLRNIAARISLIISLLTTWAVRAAMFFLCSCIDVRLSHAALHQLGVLALSPCIQLLAG